MKSNLFAIAHMSNYKREMVLFDEETDLHFIGATTTIKACHNKRRYSNKVFKGLAKSAKSSMGFFYGSKLHVVINDKGEFMAFQND
jgi:hypothetical protein